MKVLVTGSSNGIGKAIVQEFLKFNHNVIGFDIEESQITDPNYTHIIHDINNRNYPEIKDVEILVNNAGIQTQCEDDIMTNLNATIALTEEYAFNDSIKAVVNIASSSALTGSEFPHYAASKGGLIAYNKNLAQRLAKYGATSNALCPGGVITDLNRHIIESDTLYDKVIDETLLKKWATAEEIAQWTYFIAVINKSMTGENIMIDNGESINFNFIW